MADDRIVKLLEEILNTQRQHLENYKTALRHQEEAIAVTRQAAERQQQVLKTVQRLAIPLLVVVLLALLVLLLPEIGQVAVSCFRGR